MAREIAGGSGPLLPMQVVQPYPTVWNPSASRAGVSPARARYSVTALEPGARLVLTQGLLFRPRSTARLATSPAATMTEGFDVLVQLVMAAITTAPSWSGKDSPPIWIMGIVASAWSTAPSPPSPSQRSSGRAAVAGAGLAMRMVGIASVKLFAASLRRTRS